MICLTPTLSKSQSDLPQVLEVITGDMSGSALDETLFKREGLIKIMWERHRRDKSAESKGRTTIFDANREAETEVPR